jgi:hypothetical protein
MDQKLYRRRHGTEQRAWCALLLCAIAAATPGCMRARAATVVPSGPPLDIPAPPPRIVLPLDLEAEAETEPPPAQPVSSPDEPRRPPAPAKPRPAAPTEAPKVAEEAPRPVPAPPPPATTTLQTTPAAEQGEVERAIRGSMNRATAALNKIDYRALNANARTQYDTAKRFIEQAEDAIRMKNLPFAKNLADKAAVLAAQLSGQ